MAEPRQRGAGRTDVCLVVPPFDPVNFPSLGVSVLAAALMARGLSVRIVYGNLLLASRIGVDDYRTITTSSFREMLGERLFVPFAYSSETGRTLGPPVPFAPGSQVIYDRHARQIGPFVRTLTRQVLATRPTIVGITSSFQQNMAAVALARRVKAIAPATCVVMGGANVASPMGDELAKVFPWIDYFFSGEADVDFPAFCERFVGEGGRPEARVFHCAPIPDMRLASAPDFSDYFKSLHHFQTRGRLPASLPDFVTMETSRGCWWGQKHHCTFCGLNGEGMEFRKKTAARVFEEIRHLKASWGTDRFHFADNIMPMTVFGDLLPALAAWPEHPRLFFEVKANLRDDQLDLMRRGGIDAIQPGIEALSTNLLQLMRKGVSGPQNVSLLRSGRVNGIAVLWNLLYGLPGERREDYVATLSLLPKLEHLSPPSGLCQVIVDRFSPYHFDHDKFGLKSITPFSSYATIYPAGADLSRIGYHFDSDFISVLAGEPALARALSEGIAAWQNAWKKAPGKALPRVELVELGAGRSVIVDTRRIARRSLVTVSPKALATLVYFERARPRDADHGDHAAHIGELLDKDFLVDHEGSLMSLVVRTPAPYDSEAAVAGKVASTAYLVAISAPTTGTSPS